MSAVIRFLEDYQGSLTDNAHFNQQGQVVDWLPFPTCVLLVEAGKAEWAEIELPEFEPEVESVATKPKRGRKAKQTV